MRLYLAKAVQSGHSVEFEVKAENIKEALAKAKKMANNIFDYEGHGEEPRVAIRRIAESIEK